MLSSHSAFVRWAVRFFTFLSLMSTFASWPATTSAALAPNAEWLMSMPGTEEQEGFLLNCTGCHTLERIMKSTHDAEGFLDVIQRMGLYYPGSTPLKPQRLAGTATRDVERGGNGRKTAEWLASVNLSQEPTWSFQ